MPAILEKWEVQPHGPLEEIDDGILTVAGEIHNVLAICAFVCPSATNARISRSRGVSPSGRASSSRRTPRRIGRATSGATRGTSATSKPWPARSRRARAVAKAGCPASSSK